MGPLVVLVSGPPCAGKTTHVREQAAPGDLVLDQDVMGAQGFERALAGLASARAPRAWVIRCLPGPEHRAAYAAELGAAEHVHLRPSTAELIERARRRPDPHRQVAAVRAWLAREAGTAPARARAADPAPRVEAWWSPTVTATHGDGDQQRFDRGA